MSDVVLPTQITFLRNLSSIYPSLLEVVPVIDLSKLLTLSLGSLVGSSGHKLVRRSALAAARDALCSGVWGDSASRVLLLPTCLEHVSHHLQIREELNTAADIILDIVTRLQEEQDRSRTSAVFRCTSLMLEMIVSPLGTAIIAEHETVVSICSTDTTGVTLTTGLLGTLELVNSCCDQSLLILNTDTGALGRLLTVLTEMMTRPTFPLDWASYRSSVVSTLQTFIKNSEMYLTQQQQDNFDKLLWMSFFRLVTAFILSPVHLNQDVEQTISLRNDMAQLVVDAWRKCPHQIQLVPSLVGPLLELIVTSASNVRPVIVPVLLDMMRVEQEVRGNFKQMETELIDKLDMLINESEEDEEYPEAFNSLMLDLTQQLDSSETENLRHGSVFVCSLSSLLERLLDYRGTLQGDHNRNKRMTCTVNLLKFYKDDITRQELFIRYIYKLHELHLAAHNYAEAAFTLQLHAGQLEWSTRMLHADLQFPSQQVQHFFHFKHVFS